MPAPFVFRAFPFALAAALSFFSVRALAVELPDAFRATIETGIANGRFQGIAVALIDRDGHREWMFGAVEPGGAPPTADDAFEIGSTTRTFTGLLLAQALVAGEVRLEDTLGAHFPDVRFADDKLKAVTLAQLATHRSGLPNAPPNLFPRSVDDPYVAYDAAAMRAYLAHARVTTAEGAYRYSDFGIAVLGEAIAHAYGKDYRALLASDVLAPLGMNASGFGAVPRLLEGHRDGASTTHWQQQALSPAAGLRATLGDLSKFATAELRPKRVRSARRSCSRAIRVQSRAAARFRSHGRSYPYARRARTGRCSGRPASRAGSQASSASAPISSARSCCSATRASI